MKRVACALLSSGLVLLLGCGTASYSNRLNKTLADMRYRQRLDQHLGPPAQEKFKELNIFLRPPKPLGQATQFLLNSVPNMYDLEASFADPKGGANTLRMHVVARRKTAKKPQAKGAPPPPDTSMRGPFRNDVFGLLVNNFGATEENLAKVQDVTAKKNAFKRITFVSPISGDQIRAYLYGKPEDYEVAILWDVPKGAEKETAVTTGLELTLESFATGPKAERLFGGATVDEEGGVNTGAPGGGGAQPVF